MGWTLPRIFPLQRIRYPRQVLNDLRDLVIGHYRPLCNKAEIVTFRAGFMGNGSQAGIYLTTSGGLQSGDIEYP